MDIKVGKWEINEERKVFLGVLSGLAKEFDVEYDLNLIRILYVVFTIVVDVWVGVILYLFIFAIMKHNMNKKEHEALKGLNKEDVKPYDTDNLVEEQEELDKDLKYNVKDMEEDVIVSEEIEGIEDIDD